MAGLSTVTVDLERAEVVLAGRRFALNTEPDHVPAGGAGAPAARFRIVDDSDGIAATVRLLTFGERSQLVRLALAEAAPARALLESFRRAALAGPDRLIFDAVLVALNGGAEQAADFDGCAVDASRSRAWSWQRLQSTAAILVDRSVPRPEAADTAGGWQRFVFPGATPQAIEALLDSMVAMLLARGEGSTEPGELPLESATDRSSAAGLHTAPDPGPTNGIPIPGRGIRWRALAPAADVPVTTAAPLAFGADATPTEPAVGDPRARAATSSGRRLEPRAAERRNGRNAAEPGGRASDARRQPGVRTARPGRVALPGTGSSLSPARVAARASSVARPFPAAASAAYAAAGDRRVASPLSPEPAPDRLPAAGWSAAAPVPAASAEWTAHARPAGFERGWASHAMAPAATAQPALRPAPPVDVVEQVARALAAECDLRGLDQ